MYFSRNCKYSLTMIELLVRNNARGLMACVCVEGQADRGATVPRFVTCTPSIYVPSERKLLKNAAVREYVTGLVCSLQRSRSPMVVPATITTASAASTSTASAPPRAPLDTRTPTPAPSVGAVQNATVTEPRAGNSAEDFTYSWIDQARNDDAVVGKNYVSLDIASSSAVAPGATSSASPTSTGADSKPKQSQREMAAIARLRALEKQRASEL